LDYTIIGKYYGVGDLRNYNGQPLNPDGTRWANTFNIDSTGKTQEQIQELNDEFTNVAIKAQQDGYHTILIPEEDVPYLENLDPESGLGREISTMEDKRITLSEETMEHSVQGRGVVVFRKFKFTTGSQIADNIVSCAFFVSHILV
jgi:hypothetical protein